MRMPAEIETNIGKNLLAFLRFANQADVNRKNAKEIGKARLFAAFENLPKQQSFRVAELYPRTPPVGLPQTKDGLARKPRRV